MMHKVITGSLSSTDNQPWAAFSLVGQISRPAVLLNAETASEVPTSSAHSVNTLTASPRPQNFPQEQIKDMGRQSLKDVIAVPLREESPIILHL